VYVLLVSIFGYRAGRSLTPEGFITSSIIGAAAKATKGELCDNSWIIAPKTPRTPPPKAIKKARIRHLVTIAVRFRQRVGIHPARDPSKHQHC